MLDIYEYVIVVCVLLVSKECEHFLPQGKEYAVEHSEQ